MIHYPARRIGSWYAMAIVSSKFAAWLTYIVLDG